MTEAVSNSAKQLKRSVLEAMAQALYETSITQMYERIAKKKVNLPEFERYMLDLCGETDRGLSVFMLAYFDDLTKHLIVQEMSQALFKSGLELFELNGPFNSMHDRLRICAAINWISPGLYRDLSLIRSIRNEFAHNHARMSFQDQKILGYVSSLSPSEKPVLSTLSYKRKLSQRERFHIRAVLCGAEMIVQLLGAPVAMTLSLPPSAIYSRGFDGVPEIFRDIKRSAASVVLDVIQYGSPRRRRKGTPYKVKLGDGPPNKRPVQSS